MSRGFALIVVEGSLEVPVGLRLLRCVGAAQGQVRSIWKGGRSSFWRDVARYNQAASNVGPILGLADLECDPCPSGLLARYLPSGRHPDFVLRIAERMLESWLLADPQLADFLGIPASLLPPKPELLSQPKRALVDLARRSKSRPIRADLVPEPGSLGIAGKGYTPRITEFIEEHWSPVRAEARSPSLRRALEAIRRAAGR